jgi:RHS repeat-associated protein
MIEQSEGPSSTTWFYSYNNMNQMVSATEYTKATGGTLMQQGTYVYDVFGNLIEEDVYNGSTTTVSRYVRDGWNPDKPAPIGDENYDIYAVLNGSNALQTTYMNGDGVDQKVSRISSGGIAAWYWQDRLGSVNFLTDGSGNVQDQRTYDAFGDLLSETNPSFGDQFGFAAIYTDPLTGQELDARSYRPSDGVYDQQDPVDATPNNLYDYTGGDPTNATDPSGLQRTIQKLPIPFGVGQAIFEGNELSFPISRSTGRTTFSGTIIASSNADIDINEKPKGDHVYIAYLAGSPKNADEVRWMQFCCIHVYEIVQDSENHLTSRLYTGRLEVNTTTGLVWNSTVALGEPGNTFFLDSLNRAIGGYYTDGRPNESAYGGWDKDLSWIADRPTAASGFIRQYQKVADPGNNVVGVQVNVTFEDYAILISPGPRAIFATVQWTDQSNKRLRQSGWRFDHGGYPSDWYYIVSGGGDLGYEPSAKQKLVGIPGLFNAPVPVLKK